LGCEVVAEQSLIKVHWSLCVRSSKKSREHYEFGLHIENRIGLRREDWNELTVDEYGKEKELDWEGKQTKVVLGWMMKHPETHVPLRLMGLLPLKGRLLARREPGSLAALRVHDHAFWARLQ